MSRKTLSTIGTVLALVVVLGLWLWSQSGDGNGTADRAVDPGASPSASYPATADSDWSMSWSADPSDSAYDEPSADPAGDRTDPDSGLPWIDAADLPEEARQTLELIDAGGPFPYPDKDGSTFGNREGILPAESRGYYAEYTVPTPGSRDRGARRIIAGDGGELYWTQDHYESFERISR
ncbi:ribonuclease domain-containing protein [Nocardioides sp.]|uniref:ribonuclease domain-containing protein n=1 Tax=Nocardioides sp. TaxID=35761 RepID=UPI0039E3DED0